MIIELFKMALKQPLNFIVVVLCVAVLSLHSGLFDVQKVQAKLVTKQETTLAIGTQVTAMTGTLSRVDTNVKNLDENIKTFSDYQEKRLKALQENLTLQIKLHSHP